MSSKGDMMNSKASQTPVRLKVALLGCGTVGGGVLDHLRAEPDLFEVLPVLVRDAAARGPGFTDKVEVALAECPDILIELVGGADGPADWMRVALLHGAQVVTANKAAVAKHYDSLHACCGRHGSALRFSAAVGGEVPVIETLRSLDGQVVALEGVMNGTCNYLLGRLTEGVAFDEALAEAQALGFAEADPSADVDGHDAADKLSILVREAFGFALLPERIAKDSLRLLTPKAAMRARTEGKAFKQVSRCRLIENGSIEADVRLVALPLDHPLAAVQDEQNRFLLTTREGKVHDVFGKGAGRWPTAAAVFADVMDAQRALLGRAPMPDRGPLRLSA
jgi:homoserine dehydrogenase